jgi:hypothetical protein
MRALLCCALMAVLTGCIPIGFQGRTSSMSPLPDRDSGAGGGMFTETRSR